MTKKHYQKPDCGKVSAFEQQIICASDWGTSITPYTEEEIIW